MEWRLDIWKTMILPRLSLVVICGAIHVYTLMWPLGVELVDEVIEPALLFKEVGCCRPGCLQLEGQVHAHAPPDVKGRLALSDEKQFGKLLCAIDEYDDWPTISAAMKFQILTCVRPCEVRGTKRSEIDFVERMKMRRSHEVAMVDALRWE